MDTDQDTTEDTTGTTETRRRARWPWIVGGVLGVVAVALGIIALTGGESDDAGTEPGSTTNTAEVVRTDLVDLTEYDGTLGRPDADPVAAGRQGTVTATPDAGAEVSLGQALFRVDEEPIVLLEGAVPAFRDLGYGDTDLSLPAGRQGTITWAPAEGIVLVEGDEIVRIDETPAIALTGEIPMYRVLSDGSEGPDVEQLEAALVRLGYDPDGDVTVDEEFTGTTEAMVERWQEDIGVDETGVVAPGDIVFGPLPAQVVTVVADIGAVVSATSPLMEITGGDPLAGPDVAQLEASLVALGHLDTADSVLDADTVLAIALLQEEVGMEVDGVLGLGEVVFRTGTVRVAEVVAGVGTAVTPSTPVVEAGSLDLVVRVDLPAEDQGALVAGDAVTIELPDRTETPGTVISVASVATTDPQGLTTFEVEIALDDPSVAGSLDEAPVDVIVVSDTAEDVLAVPVTALLALAEGGYAVEVVAEDGSTRLVGVEPGFFADGMVEITGDVQAGATVVVP